MYTLDTITFQPVYSANGNIKMSDTTRRAIVNLGKVRNTMTAGDVAYAINRNVYKDEQVSEAQIERVMSEIARGNARGERYYDMRGTLSKQACGFYEYK